MDTTLTLSSKGQLALPKRLREDDQLSRRDVFRLQRLGRGKYLIEKLATSKPAKAKLAKSKDGFLVFHSPKGAPRLTSDLVKRIEAETT